MIKLFYVRVLITVFSVAVVFNFVRLLSDLYGAFVISLLQLLLVRQMYNFFTGRDISLGGTYAGKEFGLEVRLFVFIVFVLIYFGLFFI